MCLFSVIIPTYNRAELIEKTINSVLAQEFQDYEIIVVDDGSTDDTIKILKPYQRRIKILQQANKGPGAARNLGIKHAKGKYIAFLDSDDEWFFWTLANYEKLIREYQEPSFICGSFINLQIGEHVSSNQESSAPTAKYYKDFYSYPGFALYLFTTSSVAVKTQVIREVGGFSESGFEDLDLWLRLGTSRGYVLIESPFTAVRWFHDNNICFSEVYNRTGIQSIIETEKDGQYPGGIQRQSDRRNKICTLFRAASLTFIREGKIQDAMYIYLETFIWQLQLARFRFLLGFPLIALGKIMKQD
ncbi:family 2 glycosyl transferase [Calothrix sp. NIES-4071]|nr:family 2 glycosyl transferase [Calothrix sp. NIES-4071]BAZ56263.1 family 2 glycosyl transferase [Calothrix sp. NIES-4105]